MKAVTATAVGKALDPVCGCICAHCKDDEHFQCSDRRCEIGAAFRAEARRQGLRERLGSR